MTPSKTSLGFSPEIQERLGYYVYRLIDPRDGSVFYIGKGKGNRVYAHLNEALAYQGDEDATSAKIHQIRQIKNANLEPIHIIHRHGLTEKEAFHVEAALIDATPGLTNQISGIDSTELGPAHTLEIIRRYSAKELTINPAHRIMAINISRTFNEKMLYDAVRCAWRVSLPRARRANLVFAMLQGVCRAVYVPRTWLPATQGNFPGLISDDRPGRYGFVGDSAEKAILKRYLNKRLPLELKRTRGMASPVRYFYR